MPDPFAIASGLDSFFKSPVAQELIAEGKKTICRILAFLKTSKDPSLTRVAVLFLSYFEPSEFYQELLAILQKADRSIAEAFETGLWLIRVPDKQIAQDIVKIVSSSGNPNPLLLLQRPTAKEVRTELAGFIKQRRMPLSLYALYCYGYVLEKEDTPLMISVSKWKDIPEMSALAGIYLLRLGSSKGYEGIQAGLTAHDIKLRTLTYFELSKYLPREIIEQAKYDSSRPVDSQRPAVNTLIQAVKELFGNNSI
ncbi:MAG: hypothetical protein OIN66_02030 [Candidatus Methanoperedens sp.]|nr:hypothetical protein [Candidatus Methanoperedens sp.]